MKNIVILTPGFPQSTDDTTCIPALQALLLELKNSYGAHLNINVVSFQYPFLKGGYTWKGITCYSAGGSNSSFPNRFGTWKNVIKQVIEIHRETPIDIIHAFWLNECTLVGNWLASITKARLVCHVMGQDARASNHYLKILRLKNSFVIANSPFAADVLQRNSKIPIDAVVPFGLNPEDFIKIGLSADRTIDILGVGSLNENKNYTLFVDLFSKMKSEFRGLKGVLIGTGSQYAEIKKQIERLKLTDSLTLTGQISREEVLNYMSQSKVLLHTSSYESAGYVFLEALYCGMKVVSFETGFLPSSDSTYLCVNESEMLISLKEIFSNPQQFIRKKVPMIADTAKAIVEIYSRL